MTIEEYNKIIQMKPEDRSVDFGDDLSNKINGILIAFSKIYDIRDGWIDIITTRDAEREIKELIKEYKDK